MKKTIEYGKSGILVLSVIIIFLVIFLAFESLTLISPIGTVTERSPVFEWRGDYDNYRILVDDDKLFETPILDTEFSEEYFEYEGEFDFGEYYWKLIVIDGDRIIESKPIKFDVSISTHQVSLDFDLTEISYLEDDKGIIYHPLSWEGSPPGGHHRSGTLSFPKLSEKTKFIKLFIKAVNNVPERVFRWGSS